MEYPYCRKKKPANVGGGANDASNETSADWTEFVLGEKRK